MGAGLKQEVLRRWITRGYRVVRARRIKAASVRLCLSGDSRFYRDDPCSQEIEMSLLNLYGYLNRYGYRNFEEAAFEFLREIGSVPRDMPSPTRSPADPELFSVRVECPVCSGTADYYPYHESRPGKVHCYRCGIYHVTGDFWMYYGTTRRDPQHQAKFVAWVRATRDRSGRLFTGRNPTVASDPTKFSLTLSLDDIDTGRLPDSVNAVDDGED